jgi:hypothetical protein
VLVRQDDPHFQRRQGRGKGRAGHSERVSGVGRGAQGFTVPGRRARRGRCCASWIRRGGYSRLTLRRVSAAACGAWNAASLPMTAACVPAARTRADPQPHRPRLATRMGAPVLRLDPRVVLVRRPRLYLERGRPRRGQGHRRRGAGRVGADQGALAAHGVW